MKSWFYRLSKEKLVEIAAMYGVDDADTLGRGAAANERIRRRPPRRIHGRAREIERDFRASTDLHPYAGSEQGGGFFRTEVFGGRLLGAQPDE